jgi:TIR domain
MRRAFISYSHEDANLVGLLRALLKSHGVEAWCSAFDIEGGQDFRNEITQGMSQADVLIAVVSQNSSKSKWVNREITAFGATKPESRIVPLALDSTDPNEVYDGLANYQLLPYSADGLERLFQVFEKKFLENGFHHERRSETRRKGDRRKGVADRRHWDLCRYRTGLWTHFERTRDTTRDAKMEIAIKTLQDVAGTLTPEVSRYQYRDRGTGDILDCHGVIKEALNLAWLQLRSQGSATVQLVTDTFAEKIWESFVVSAIDRRSGREQRMTDRRGGTSTAANGQSLDAKKASA